MKSCIGLTVKSGYLTQYFDAFFSCGSQMIALIVSIGFDQLFEKV